MKIAIIGAGISGLTAAYRLSGRHEITVFEANDYIGGHTHTVDVELNGEHHAIDTGFIVFNDWTYPNFIKLLDELAVPSQATSMSFSVRCDRTGLEYNGSSLNGLFAQRRNLFRPSFHRMLRDIMRFNREGLALAETRQTDNASEVTVGEFLKEHRYSREFADQYLLPMGSAIWSCPTGTFENFPIRFIAEFYHNHGLLSVRHRPTWRVIEGGSRSYVAAMTAKFRERIRLNAPVQQVRRDSDGVEVVPKGGPAERFEHVVFTCHSDQALRMLVDPTAVEKELLNAFPYEQNIAVLHYDTAPLPRRQRAWASWNYLIPARPTAHSTVSYCMNILQHLRSKNVFSVTLNSDEFIDPGKVLQRFEYHHPIFTTQRTAAQARHSELLNANRSSFCGAYWGNGFHEDGVVSALKVCEALDGA